jgi:hypothetical protein
VVFPPDVAQRALRLCRLLAQLRFQQTLKNSICESRDGCCIVVEERISIYCDIKRVSELQSAHHALVTKDRVSEKPKIQVSEAKRREAYSAGGRSAPLFKKELSGCSVLVRDSARRLGGCGGGARGGRLLVLGRSLDMSANTCRTKR